MLRIEDTVLTLVDVQGKLAQLMYNRDELFANLQKLLRGAQALALPVIWVEQNPSRMGETIAELRDLLKGETAIAKMSFSCCGDAAFLDRLRLLRRHHVLLAGIETHVCIYQTALDLLALQFQVDVVADAVSSRTASNRSLALERIRCAGANLTSVEMALFELLKTAEHPAFRAILALVK
jgi:nicotinamidase-related amidase